MELQDDMIAANRHFPTHFVWRHLNLDQYDAENIKAIVNYMKKNTFVVKYN